jgi:radical SAM family uncharacterized protein
MTWSIKALYQKRLSREQGTVHKDAGGRLRVALAYPNTYYVGMSNLGFLSLYKWLNDYPDVVAERVFLPEGEELSLYQKSGATLMSLESQAPVGGFDVLAFSVSFENDYINLLTILDLARIPSFCSARDRSHPPVLAGGAAILLNPEPIAPFVDLFLIGEAEALLDSVIKFLRECKRSGWPSSEELKAIAQEPGFYVPSLYQVSYDDKGRIAEFSPQPGVPHKVKRVRAFPGAWELPQSTIVTPDTHFSGMALLEIGRACGRGCRFCAAGFIYRPPRLIDEPILLNEIAKALERSPKVGLISPGIADIPEINEVLKFVLQHGGWGAPSSLRADALDEDLLASLQKMGQKSLAIAPEAGSERLRRVINKDLTEEEILEAILKLYHAGLKTLKLYFMLGLPTEELIDVEAIPSLVKRMRHHLLKNRDKGAVIPLLSVSVSCFVPKAHTPFQWEAMERVENLKKKLTTLRKSIQSAKVARIHYEPPKWAYVQALLSLGDRRVSTIIREAAYRGGSWQEAFSQTEVNPDFFVYRHREMDEILPWDFIDHGISKKFLMEEHQRAFQEKPSPSCDPDHCRRCGVC